MTPIVKFIYVLIGLLFITIGLMMYQLGKMEEFFIWIVPMALIRILHSILLIKLKE